ncbi:MFS transporter [Streptomyces johnsoniae]|uniref:MFS transporter n=1 Tax=Streptomyces johnsoniae TaxID=3075532 RepID=A0ABU2S6C4_9ACTN|nr:MFS transporter [Streptomyces sp. DSM 41886]MDT0444518.1 MFS transporter [Streptomyces sp. DSM 41886]
MNPYRTVLHNRRLSFLLLGDFVSKLGDGMLLVALPLLALRIHEPLNEALVVSLVLAAPSLISLPLGIRVGLSRSRPDPKRVIAADCVLRALVFTGLGVLAAQDALSLWPLFIALLLGSALRAISGASRRVLATGMAGEQDRLAVNSVLGTNDSTSLYILGPSLAGVLVLWTGPWLPLLLDGLSFLVLAAALIGVPAAHRDGAAAEQPRSGWQILRRTAGLWPLFSVAFAFNMLWGPVEVILPLFVQEDLGANEATYGFMMTALGVGAVAGSLGTAYLRKFPPGRVLTVLVVCWGLSLGLIAAAPEPVVAGFAIAIGGLVWAPFVPVMYTLLQDRLAQDDQQPVLTFWSAGYNTAGPVGVLCAAPLVALAGTRGGMFVSAALTIALVVPAVVAERRLGVRGEPVRAGV